MVSRGSSEQISSAGRLVAALASSIESEHAKKRSAQSRGQASGRAKNSAVTSGKPVDGRKSKTDLSSGLPTESDTCCYPAVTLTHESSAPSDVDDCRHKLEQTALMSTAQNMCRGGSSRTPSVKEYSLFDNHFSKAVESVLKNDICVSNARNAFVGAPAMALSYPTVDEALLAKAPGYRASTASPCSGRFLAERPRKYSNDSSSSLSSVKSCEDSPSTITGGRILPPSHRPRTGHQIPDIPHTSAFHSVHDLPQIPVHAPSPFQDFRSTIEAASTPVDNDATPTTVAGPQTVSEHYSSPNQPMTLPRISTDLNPNAPDFVFRPTTCQIPHVDSNILASSTSSSDVPELTATSSSSFFIPSEMPAPGRWSEPVMGLTDGGPSTAFDIGVPALSLDVSPPQWTVPNTLLQESLTFG